MTDPSLFDPDSPEPMGENPSDGPAGPQEGTQKVSEPETGSDSTDSGVEAADVSCAAATVPSHGPQLDPSCVATPDPSSPAGSELSCSTVVDASCPPGAEVSCGSQGEPSLEVRVDGVAVAVESAGLADQDRFEVVADGVVIATVAQRLVPGRPYGWVYAVDPEVDPVCDGSRMYPSPATAVTAAGLQHRAGSSARMAFDAGVALPTPITKVAKE